jgi:hypothetical protein
MRNFRSLAFAAMTTAALAYPTTASATTIFVDGNTSFSVNWLLTSTNPDLAGSALFTISNWTDQAFKLTVSNIANSTATTPNINARLVSFGFGLSPDATSFTSIVNGATFAFGFSNFPAFQTVDVCAFAGNNCAGGGNGGLSPGQTSSDILSMLISGNFADGVTFSPVAVKFQTAVGSFEFDGGTPNTPVPEPASLLLFGSGLVAVGYKARRMLR